MAANAIFSSFHRPQPISAPAKAARPDTIVAPSRALPEAPRPASIAVPKVAPPAWADLSSIDVASDQLGLLHPAMVYLFAGLSGSVPALLDAETSGLYRPFDFELPPWCGLGCDVPSEPAAGLAAGTRLLTQRGEIAIESLLPGDRVMTLSRPSLLPILWIGRSKAEPLVQIAAGAFGPDTPRRTILVGSAQRVIRSDDGRPASSLTDQRGVVTVAADGRELFHLDVGRRDVLFAEGLPVASGTRASAIL